MFFAPWMIVASPAFVMPPQISAQGIQAAGSATKAPAAVTLNPPVWVVDASGGGDFLEIADAVAVAGEGSLVFVKPGTYHLPVVIDDRSVDVMADGMHQVVLTQPLTVQNQGQDKQVSIGGLELLEGFLIEDCLGPVQMQDCRVPATNVAVGPPPGTMYNEWILCGIGESKQTVRNSSGVSFSDCEFHGAPGIDADGSVVDGIPGQHGLLVEGSQVALYSCSLVGGLGGIGFGPGHYPSVSGSGGDGLRVKGMGSQVTHCGLVADGAPAGGGIGDVSTVTFGCDGIGVRVDSGSTADMCDPNSLTFRIDPVVRGGNIAWYTVEGPPGAVAYLMVGNALDWQPQGTGLGIQHVQMPITTWTMGPIPASGSLTRPFPIRGPRTPGGFVGAQFQAYTNVGWPVYRSGVRRMVVVHPSL